MTKVFNKRLQLKKKFLHCSVISEKKIIETQFLTTKFNSDH